MMQKVIKKSYWGYWDELDNLKLKDGEKLILQWPDEEKTYETCHVRIQCDLRRGPHNIAYVIVKIHNLNVEVPLAQDGILCERVK